MTDAQISLVAIILSAVVSAAVVWRCELDFARTATDEDRRDLHEHLPVWIRRIIGDTTQDE